MLVEQWPHSERQDISWMNEAYGEPEIAIVFSADKDDLRDFHFELSAVAILIDVPPFLDRQLPSTGFSDFSTSPTGSRENSDTQDLKTNEGSSDVEMHL